MNFTFLNPAFLFGLPLLGIPIFLHFLSKKKKTPFYFSETRFIKMALTNVIKRHKILEIILLILRCLVILVLVLLFARPILYTGYFSKNDKSSISTVLLVDNSYSMAQKLKNGKTVFEEAKNTTIRFVNSMSKSDRIAVLTVNSDVEPIISYVSSVNDGIREKIKKLNISFKNTNISTGISASLKVLEAEPASNKQIILITDMAEHGYQAQNVQFLVKDVRFIVINLGDEPSNVAVTNTLFNPPVLNQPCNFNITVNNFSSSKINNLPISFYIDDKKVNHGYLEIKSNEFYVKTFSNVLQNPVPHLSKIEIGSDSLEVDNHYYFVVTPVKKLKILCVDGDPKASLYFSETFYLKFALKPKAQYSDFDVDVCNKTELDKISLSNYNAIFFCNALPSSQTTIKNYVKNGGGVVFFLGDKIKPEDVSGFTDILPGTIISPKEDGKYKIILGETGNLLLTEKDIDLTTVEVYKYFKILPKSDSKIFLNFDTQDVCLIGSEKVMLFASTVDRDWTNLPVKPMYLPLINKMVQYVCSDFSGAFDCSVKVGGIIKIPFKFEDLPEYFEIITPVGKKLNLASARTKDFCGLEFKNIDEPGFYQLKYFSKGKLETKIYSANLNFDTNESDLKKAKIKELEKILPKISITEIKDAKNLERDILYLTRGKNISGTLAFLLVSLLIAETFLANWKKQ